MYRHQSAPDCEGQPHSKWQLLRARFSYALDGLTDSQEFAGALAILIVLLLMALHIMVLMCVGSAVIGLLGRAWVWYEALGFGICLNAVWNAVAISVQLQTESRY